MEQGLEKGGAGKVSTGVVRVKTYECQLWGQDRHSERKSRVTRGQTSPWARGGRS